MWIGVGKGDSGEVGRRPASRWTASKFVHMAKMKAGAEAAIARRAERAAESERKQAEAQAAVDQAKELERVA